MNLEEYAVMYHVEDTLWWYHGMEKITRAMIERYYPRGAGLKILDAGCGTGGGMRYLAQYGCVTGLDLQHYALQLNRRRGASPLACGDVTTLPFLSASFDIVTSLDVLAMLPVGLDGGALSEAVRVLKPGGRLFLRVPAHNWLRGIHDRTWDVCYRYPKREIVEKIAHAGLTIEHSSYANMWLFPVSVVKRALEPLLPRQKGSDLTLNVGVFNPALKFILSSEAPWVASHRLPIGLSAIVVARKSKPSEN